MLGRSRLGQCTLQDFKDACSSILHNHNNDDACKTVVNMLILQRQDVSERFYNRIDQRQTDIPDRHDIVPESTT